MSHLGTRTSRFKRWITGRWYLRARSEEEAVKAEVEKRQAQISRELMRIKQIQEARRA